MWELDHKESWELKNWCFWIVGLDKILESPLECKESKPVNPKGNQPWIFIGRTDVKLKLQYFGHLIWRTDLLEKTLMLGKIEGRRIRGQQRMRWLDGITDSMDMRLRKFWDRVKDREACCSAGHGVSKIRTWLSDWTTTNVIPMNYFDFVLFCGSFVLGLIVYNIFLYPQGYVLHLLKFTDLSFPISLFQIQ